MTAKVVARCEGVGGMEERSSRSEASPRRTAERIAEEIASQRPTEREIHKKLNEADEGCSDGAGKFVAGKCLLAID
ncbi:hypothetical protein ACOJBO_11660 [Rhizobium beringeri]